MHPPRLLRSGVVEKTWMVLRMRRITVSIRERAVSTARRCAPFLGTRGPSEPVTAEAAAEAGTVRFLPVLPFTAATLPS